MSHYGPSPEGTRRCREGNLPTTSLAFRRDVGQTADLDRLYQAVKAKGRIDIVFANAALLNLLLWERSRRSISTNSSTSM